jgi:hypothetical protein
MNPLGDASNRLGALPQSGRSGSKRQRLEQLQSQQATFQHVVSAESSPWHAAQVDRKLNHVIACVPDSTEVHRMQLQLSGIRL